MVVEIPPPRAPSGGRISLVKARPPAFGRMSSWSTGVAIHELPLADFLARLLVAGFIGMLIGLERQLSGRPAGLHTTGLVAAGAALFATIEPAAAGSNSYRIIANIVTGVGFLAGGVILREGGSVSGLNTAATIWATAAVGVLAGLALFREAAIGALAIIGINLLMGFGSRINVRRERD